MKIIQIALAIIFCVTSACSQENMKNEKEIIRQPAVAGTFYPSNPDTLRAMIEGFLDRKSPRALNTQYEIAAIVSPHAGYVFSGGVAGKVYRELIGRKYDAVVVIAPSHYLPFTISAVYNGDYYQTPLGKCRIDKELAASIAESHYGVALSDNGHKVDAKNREHSLEVQLPFLQVVQSDVPIVPIIMGAQDNVTVNALFLALVKAIRESGKRVLIVASSDLSHFHDYERARQLDIPAVKTFESFNYFKLANKFFTRSWEACGGGPIVTAMMTAEQLGGSRSVALSYATSADVEAGAGSRNRVVGYFSGAILKTGEDPLDFSRKFSEDDKIELLEIAKNAVRAAANNDSTTVVPHIITRSLSTELAAFVTLKKDGRLRGCMGHTFADKPVVYEVEAAGRLAAINDPRFKEVTPAEVGQLEYEVTILSRFKRVLDPEEIVVGRDGVFLRQARNSGLFLPQVAPENNWTREEFLENLGRKAGLAKDAYLNPDAELYLFRSLIIHND